jgi:hypothetical protein
VAFATAEGGEIHPSFGVLWLAASVVEPAGGAAGGVVVPRAGAAGEVRAVLA